MPVYHIIYDNGPDWPDDGNDRYEHYVFGDGEIIEVKLDWDKHQESREAIQADIKRLTEISAWCKDAGYDFPKRLMRRVSWLEETDEHWEPPPPPIPKEDIQPRINFGMFKVDVNVGDTLEDVLKLKDVRNMFGAGKTLGDWLKDKSGRLGFYSEKQKVDTDFVFSGGDIVEGAIRIAEKGRA